MTAAPGGSSRASYEQTVRYRASGRGWHAGEEVQVCRYSVSKQSDLRNRVGHRWWKWKGADLAVEVGGGRQSSIERRVEVCGGQQARLHAPKVGGVQEAFRGCLGGV